MGLVLRQFTFAHVAMALGLALLGGSCGADIIWLKDGTSQSGRILDQSDQRLRLKRSTGETLEIARSDIAGIRINIDEQRLQSLSRNRPQEYFDYAEELSAEEKDPAAIQLATHLLRLCVVLTSDSTQEQDGQGLLHQSALLALAKLEDQPDRLKHIRNRMLLLTGNEKYRPSSGEPMPDKQQLTRLRRLIKSIRRQESQLAIELLRDPDNQAAIQKWSNRVSIEEWNAWARSNALDDLTLRRLLTAELEVIAMIAGRKASTEAHRNESWVIQSAMQSSKHSAQSVPLSINEILPAAFDTQANQFRGGKWVRAAGEQ